MPQKTYIGDSVYADVEDGMIKLTTENGGPDGPSNTIYLEPRVFESLCDYVKYVKEEVAEQARLEKLNQQ